MVYFKQEKLRFPRHFGLFSGKFRLVNDTTKEEFVFELSNISEDPRWYEFDLTSVSLQPGTYTYRLGDDCGLLQVGEYQVKEKTVYEEKKTNVIYER